MIPVKLKLKNFLSYGENVPPLDFTQFHVACLSGANGQGKSALLDALTWSIWGEGRKGSQERKADSSLLRMGQENMQVEFVFDLEGHRYRVIRSFFHAGKTSRAGLEFQVYDYEKNKYISLTCPSTRETQEKITKTLRLDYQTFINSAFILQGRTNEFSKKTAKERKEVLSEILGLSHYDELVILAKSILKVTNDIIMAKDSRLGYIAQELTQSRFYESRIKELSEKEARISQDIIGKETRVTESRNEVNSLEHKSEQANELTKTTEQQRQEISRVQEEIESKLSEITACKKVISQKDTIVTEFMDYQRVNTENSELTSKLQEVRKVEGDKLIVEGEIGGEKSNLIVEIRNKEDRQKDFQDKAEQKEKRKTDLAVLEDKVRAIKSLEKESKKIQEEINKTNIDLNDTKGRIAGLEKSNKSNEEKIYLLKDNPKGECPLCEAKLNADRKKKIEANLNKEIKSNLKGIEKLKEEEGLLRISKIRPNDRLEEIKRNIRHKDAWQLQLSKTQLEYKESEQAIKRAEKLEDEIVIIKEILENKSYAVEKHKKLEELEEKIKSIGYGEARHFQVGNMLEKLHEATANNVRLEEAEKKISSLEGDLVGWENDQQRRWLELKTLEKKIEEIKAKLEGLPSLKEKLIQEEESLRCDLSAKEEVLGQKGGYQSKFDQCLKLKEEKKEIEGGLKKSYKEKDLYEKLIVAFGKNGIQALIIENALPEIEEEANKLLDRLTSNGTRIAMESLRDLKSGRLKETLEIKISDELGVRDYELYSGGEAFRIDFSLRIALSKLLARRAGTRLRTLVIDEGFGTQDEEGLDNIVEAIRTISDDFDKILVITHLETLKNAFPVKIEVTKLPEVGSQFKIIKS